MTVTQDVPIWSCRSISPWALWVILMEQYDTNPLASKICWRILAVCASCSWARLKIFALPDGMSTVGDCSWHKFKVNPTCKGDLSTDLWKSWQVSVGMSRWRHAVASGWGSWDAVPLAALVWTQCQDLGRNAPTTDDIVILKDKLSFLMVYWLWIGPTLSIIPAWSRPDCCGSKEG